MTKVEQKIEISKYRFLSTEKNPNFLPGIAVPLRSCQEHHNACKNITTGIEVYEHLFGFIETTPKWLTVLMRPDDHLYHTDSLKSRMNRQTKAVKRFTDFYEPLYRRRQVSVLFFTFTRLNYADKDMRSMLNCVKSRLKSLKWPLRGYLWVLEVKANENMDGGFHLHYHLVIAIDRIRIQKIPKELKLEDLWGQRTGVEFIKKSVRGYLSGYMMKSAGKLNNHRAYQISRKLL